MSFQVVKDNDPNLLLSNSVLSDNIPIQDGETLTYSTAKEAWVRSGAPFMISYGLLNTGYTIPNSENVPVDWSNAVIMNESSNFKVIGTNIVCQRSGFYSVSAFVDFYAPGGVTRTVGISTSGPTDTDINAIFSLNQWGSTLAYPGSVANVSAIGYIIEGNTLDIVTSQDDEFPLTDCPISMTIIGV